VTVTSIAPPILVTPEPTATPTATQASAGPPVVELFDTEVLTGTILANRTEVTTTFFLEGRLYELQPLRSTGVALARPLTVLTLYNCEISSVEASADCFWDPYPVRRDGFYEIVNGAEEGAPLSLILEEAGAPPVDQVWIQNRTGHVERFMFEDTLYELENSHVLEISLEDVGEADTAIAQIYLRRCLGVEQRAVCEWLPQTVIGGVYYALVDQTEEGVLPNSAVTTIQLELVLGEERLALLVTPTPEPTPEPTAPAVAESAPAEAASADTLFCQIQVPTLNVRAGPGTEYLVVGQIRGSDPNGGRVAVAGRSAADDWLALDESVIPGGWVINAPNFVICEGNTTSLAVARVSDGRLAEATPTPASVAASDDPATADDEAGEAADPEPAAQAGAGGIPEGQVRLIATNAFDQDIRFTLSAPEHGLPEGTPSEYDLKPGESVSFVIRAGRVQFSASSPFRSSSGNAEFIMEEGTARELFLRFTQSSDDPNRWELRWE
jgi:hypothetical protein